MTAKTLTRPQRAMQIERRTSRTWTPCAGGVSIPSQTIADKRYVTTEASCTCPDSLYRVGKPGGPSACKHSLALRLDSARHRQPVDANTAALAQRYTDIFGEN